MSGGNFDSLTVTGISNLNGDVGIGTTTIPTHSRLAVIGGAVTVGSSPGTADAAIHITCSFGGFDRLLQMNPIGGSKPGLNLLASNDAAGRQQWWVWGVTPDNRWRIQAGAGFGASGGLTIDSAGNLLVAGDVQLQNADCAEDFEVVAAVGVEPGTVMVLTDDGQLERGTKPYDKRVTGVVSGAGDLRPGLVLGRQPGHTDRLPIALIGKVYCKVDTAHGPIAVGDLLTTSATPGQAMKASDPGRAFGAVIGKALQPLASGQGLIRILVALQ